MNRLIHIFEETACPSLETLQNYVAEKVDTDERFTVEEHLLSCSLCRDAVEGLSYSSSAKAVQQRIISLKREQRKRLFTKAEPRQKLSKRQSRVVPLQIHHIFVAAVAGIAFLILTVFIMNKVVDQETELTSNHIALETEEPAAAPPLSVPVVPDSSLLAATSPVVTPEQTETTSISPSAVSPTLTPRPGLSAQQVNDQEDVPIEIEPSFTSRIEETRSKASQVSIENESKSSAVNGKIAAQRLSQRPVLIDSSLLDESLSSTMALDSDKKRSKANSTAGIPANVPPSDWDEVFSKTYKRKNLKVFEYDDREYRAQTKFEVLREIRQEGIALYNAGHYNDASLKFDEVIQSSRNDAEALFYLAKIKHKKGELKRAQQLLKKVKRLKDSNYAEDASFILAQIYIKRSKLKQAEQELDELISKKGKRTSEAQILRRKLKD